MVGLHRNNLWWIVAGAISLRSSEEDVHRVSSDKKNLLHFGHNSSLLRPDNCHVHCLHLCRVEVVGKRLTWRAERGQHQPPGPSKEKGTLKKDTPDGETHYNSQSFFTYLLCPFSLAVNISHSMHKERRCRNYFLIHPLPSRNSLPLAARKSTLTSAWWMFPLLHI